MFCGVPWDSSPSAREDNFACKGVSLGRACRRVGNKYVYFVAYKHVLVWPVEVHYLLKSLRLGGELNGGVASPSL